MRARRKWEELSDEDPAAGLLNLFDVWIAFAVALLLAMAGYLNVPEMLSAQSDVTLVKNPGAANMEIIRKEGVKITRYRATAEEMTGEGRKLGTAYQLQSGDVVYVPEATSSTPPAAAAAAGSGTP
jgi:hypothetical protein